MIRETGWGVAQYLDQPIADVLELVAQMNDEPPAHRILAWRYLKPKVVKLTEQQIEQQHTELVGELGQNARKMPDHMKEMLRWAEEQTARMKEKS